MLGIHLSKGKTSQQWGWEEGGDKEAWIYSHGRPHSNEAPPQVARLPQLCTRGVDTEPAAPALPIPITIWHRAYRHTGGCRGGPCHVAGAERQSGEGCGALEVRGCRHFPGYRLCSEPVTRGNTLKAGQRRGVPGGAAAADAAASHTLPAVGSWTAIVSPEWG